MGIIVLIIIGVIIYFIVKTNNDDKQRKRAWEYQQDLINRGIKKRCSDGVLRFTAEANEWEKTHHSDYYYLKNEKSYSESRLNSMTLTEIINTAKPFHEEDEQKRKAKIARLERERQYLKDPMNHYSFKINGNNANISGIYMVRNNRNERFYIGSSMNIQKRISNHLYNLRNNNHHAYKLQADFNDYGENAFSFYVLKDVDMEEEFARDVFGHPYKKWEVTDKMKRARLEKYEQQLIDRFEPAYNVYKDVNQWKKDNYGSKYYG